jgi:hypothetical protein
MTRAEYQAAMRDVSKLAARTEIEAAGRLRAATREALAPVIAEITRGKKPAGIDKPKLAEAITGVIKTEGAKPVEKIREVRREIEESLAAKFGAPVPAPKAAATVMNAKRKAQTDYRTGGAYGRVLSGKRVSAYAKDPETGKITWSDKALEYAFTKRYDLSALVWASVEEMEERIFDVINGGLALGRDPVDIARDLETYINYENGGERVLGRWGAMFPNTEAGRRAAWERERLAFYGIQPGSEEANTILSTPDVKDWVNEKMAEKTRKGAPLLPDAVKQYARRIGKAGLDYRAIRIVRTETARMVADEEADFAKNSYAATGQVDWILKSGREQWGCSCEEYAKGGPYMIDNLPSEIPVHPNCDCELRPRLKSDAELKATFKTLMGIE